MKKLICCLLAGILLLCVGCGEAGTGAMEEPKEAPGGSGETQPGSGEASGSTEASAEKTNPPVREEKAAAPTFNYVELDPPDAVAQANHVYCTYQSEDCVLWSVGVRNSNVTGPLHFTDQFVLWSSNGDVQHFKMDTDCDIFSAVPYEEGILYGAYQMSEDAGDKKDGAYFYDYLYGTYRWDLCYTDGEKTLVLDSGTGCSWVDDPYLFMLDGMPHYFWVNRNDDKTESEYGVSRVVDGEVQEVFRDHVVLPWENIVHCNGRQYCFDIDDGRDYATIVVGDADGILFEYQLEEKLCSYCITEQYLVCVVAYEGQSRGTVIMVDLETQEAESFDEIYGALWQLNGIGNIVLSVNNNWSPRYIDLEAKEAGCGRHPVSGLTPHNEPARYYPIDENRFYCLVGYGKDSSGEGDDYRFYLLTLE